MDYNVLQLVQIVSFILDKIGGTANISGIATDGDNLKVVCKNGEVFNFKCEKL